jgi:hypothetical protein
MTQADSVHSTPPLNTSKSHLLDETTSRRRFLSTAAGIAAGGTALALAIPPASAADDPVFGLIAAHKQILETVRATAAEIRHSTEDEASALEEGVFAEQNGDEFDLFVELTEAVPTTLAGVVALVTYLDEVNRKDPWKFEDNYATPLIGALATAFSRMAVTS